MNSWKFVKFVNISPVNFCAILTVLYKLYAVNKCIPVRPNVLTVLLEYINFKSEYVVTQNKHLGGYVAIACLLLFCISF